MEITLLGTLTLMILGYLVYALFHPEQF
ncbi:MAG: K(+)-transporting ATPase subunit F [Bdellovibrionaceae bacterium]|nr:K(+)-transporting ATPase subunit F [Pseudobdellovibrionaceae bacterium]